jgi:heptose-I-phosphate ethanolaminephosphotransferase
MENKYKRIQNICLSGIITGIIIQLNWAQGLLIEKGLIACLAQHWIRLSISGILGGLIFYSLVKLAEYFAQKINSIQPNEIGSFLSTFYILLGYLCFRPYDQLLWILLILVPIVYRAKYYLKNLVLFQGFNNIFLVYIFFLVFLFFKEFLLIILSGLTQPYWYYFSLLGTPLLFLIIPIAIPRITRGYVVVIGILYFIASFITNSHILLYKADMPPSTYYAIWETTVTESGDFIKEYVSASIIGVNALLLGIMIIMLLKIRKPFPALPLKDRMVLISVIILLHFTFQSFQYNLPNKFINSYIQFKRELNKFKDAFEFRKNNPLGKQAEISCSDTSQTFVLIIGESASIYHQGLYGYYRNTNPLLGGIKDELYIFDSVISPHSHTNPVLAKVLTFANFEDMEAMYKKRSIIEYMKDAGYKTYWFSNQQFANEFNTLSTMIGLQADEKIFTNINNVDSAGSKPIYDEALLGSYQKALNDDAKKKFIVLHLMGSHSDKAKRYPENFNKFTDTTDFPKRNYNRPWVYHVTNTHDNSVLYNDYVLFQTIQMLKQKKGNAIWLYFSDHGEEIFDYRDFWGHSEANASIYMFDIPFIVWLSDEYIKLHPNKVKSLSEYLHRKYQTDDVIHSIIDLSGCYSADFNPAKSVFNPEFKYEKRYIYGHDYDSLRAAGKKSITD